MIHFIKCPLTGSVNIKEVVKTKDFTVSGETFGIWENEKGNYRFTNPVPEKYNLGKYYESEDYISHSRTRKGLINKLYHSAQVYTMAYKRKSVQAVTGMKIGKLLDYGCGTGEFAAMMNRSGWDAEGFEPGEIAAAIATEKNKITLFSESDLEKNRKEAYDCITLWHVLEHVYEPKECLSGLVQLLKPGGKILVALPNFQSQDAEFYGKYWAGYDVPRHLHHFSYDSFVELAKKAGLQVPELRRMHLDAFYVSMLSEKYKESKGSIIRGVITGARSWLAGLKDKKRGSSLLFVCHHH